MTYGDIVLLYRFLGVVEGAAMTLPENLQGLVLDECEIVNDILEREQQALAERRCE